MDSYIPKEMHNLDDQLFGRNSTVNTDDVIAASRCAEDAAQGEDWLDGLLEGVILILSFIGVLSIAVAIGLYTSGFFHWIATKLPDNKVLQFLFG